MRHELKLNMISLLKVLLISRSEISKMQSIKTLLIIFCFFKLNFATIRSCIKENEENRICFLSIGGINKGYVAPYPFVLNTTMILREVIEINEKESSITIQVMLIATWIDPRIGLSKGTIG